MSVKQMDALLAGKIPAGVYRFNARTATPALLQQAKAQGCCAFALNGLEIQDKQSFLAAGARAMNFPSYFGKNWDAFYDCVTDLSWMPATSYLMLYDQIAPFARNHPEEWKTALELMQDAVAFWRTHNRAFSVLLRRTEGLTPQLPLLGK